MTNRNNLPLACLPIFIPTNIFLSPSLTTRLQYSSFYFCSYSVLFVCLLILLRLLINFCINFSRSSYYNTAFFLFLYVLTLCLSFCVSISIHFSLCFSYYKTAFSISFCYNLTLWARVPIYIYPFFCLLLLLQDVILSFYVSVLTQTS